MSRSLPIWAQRDTTFLLNSWALRVTIGSDFHQSQALSRSYSSNWPNSLNYHTSMAIGYSPRRPDAVIGTSDADITISLFMDQSNSHWCNRSCILPARHRSSPVDQFPWARVLSYRKEIPTSGIRLAVKNSKALPQSANQLQNINCIPFLDIFIVY